MSAPSHIDSSRPVSFSGLGVALITPFDHHGDVDFDALAKLVEHVLAGGVDYIVLMGTTGETSTLSMTERKEILDFVRTRLRGRIPLVLGMGGNCTAALLQQVQKFDLCGVDALLSVVPFYNKPTQEGLYRHYAALAETTHLPIILYNVPGRCGSDIQPETVVRLRRDYPHKIIGIKEASGRVERVSQLVGMLDSDFIVLSGDDLLTPEFMQAGAKGAISVFANAFPRRAVAIVRACQAGNDATPLSAPLSRIYFDLFADGNPAGIKYLLASMGHIPSGRLRLPLVEVSPGVAARLKEEGDELLRLGIN